MKRLLLLLVASCVAETPDTPATPALVFVSGSHTFTSGERIVPGAVLGAYATWYGVCYQKDLTTDKEEGIRCDIQSFVLTPACDAGCDAPAAETSAAGEAHVDLAITELGPVAIRATLFNRDTQESISTRRDLVAVAPDDLLVDCFDRNDPTRSCPLTTTAAAPIIQLTAVLHGDAEDLALGSSAVLVNGQPVSIELTRSVFDLRVAFPSLVEPDGSLQPGTYELDVELGGKHFHPTVDVATT